jgi:hypothetical protein
LLAFWVLIILLIIPILVTIFSNKTVVMNNRLKSAFEEADYIMLSDITPFDWDKAFIVEDSYTGGGYLDKRLRAYARMPMNNFRCPYSTASSPDGRGRWKGSGTGF